VRLATDGKLYVHTGVGNLGTYSHTSTSRVAAEMLKMKWDNCVVVRGDSSKHLPWNNGQFGSNTSFTMTRTNHAAALDAVAKLKEIAAMDLGGTAADYESAARLFLRADPSKKLTIRRGAARHRARRQFDGHDVPADLNVATRLRRASRRAHRVAGQPAAHRDGARARRGFVEIELDRDTGKFTILTTWRRRLRHAPPSDSRPRSRAARSASASELGAPHLRPQNGLPAPSASSSRRRPTST
jgi:CO/xanthine dehydrogenase Mo-binding subunit